MGYFWNNIIGYKENALEKESILLHNVWPITVGVGNFATSDKEFDGPFFKLNTL